MRFLKRKTWHRAARGLVSLTVLLGVCAMMFPLPISPPAVETQEKDDSEPFPCQDRPCGCQSASQCWKKCCCFTNTQKLAWAKSRGVRVPEYVKLAAQREADSERELCSLPKPESDRGLMLAAGSDNKTGSHDRISTKSVKSPTCIHCRPSGSRDAASPGNSAIADNKADSQHSDATKPVRKSRSRKWLLAVSAAKCHGQGPFGLAVLSALIPDAPCVDVSAGMIVESCIPVSELLASATLRPPLPPPKIG